MKKFFATSLFALALTVLALPVFAWADPDEESEVQPPAKHSIIVQVQSYSGSGTASASVSQASEGEKVFLSATPAEGCEFLQWKVQSGDIVISDNCFVMGSTDVKILVYFDHDRTAPHNIIVYSEGNGTATASISKAVKGTEVILTATPDEGYEFMGWTAGFTYQSDYSLTGNTLIMGGEPIQIYANFAPIVIRPTNLRWKGSTATWDEVPGADGYMVFFYDGSYTGATSDDGTYRMRPTNTLSYDLTDSIVAAGLGSFKFAVGAHFPGTGFDRGTVSSTFSPVKTFSNITVQTDGNGTAFASSQIAGSGDTVRLSATPNSGYMFSGWQVVSGGISVSNNRFTMETMPVTVKALFAPITHSVTIQIDGKGTAIADFEDAAEGQLVTLSATPEHGYKLQEWRVISGDIIVSNNSFTMGKNDAILAAVFVAEEPVEEETISESDPITEPNSEKAQSSAPFIIGVLCGALGAGLLAALLWFLLKKNR